MSEDKITKGCKGSSIKTSEDNGCCTNESGKITPDENCCVDEVGEMVQKLVRMFQLFERDQIKVHGFTSSQCYSLLEILKSGSLTMNELSDRMNLDSSTMTRVIDKLVRDELINRERDEADRRIVLVALTEKGKEAALMLNSSVNEYYKKITANLPEGTIDEVLRAVSILIKAFEIANPN